MVVVHVEPSQSRRKRLNRRKNYRKKQRNFSAGELKIKYNNENNLIFLFIATNKKIFFGFFGL